MFCWNYKRPELQNISMDSVQMPSPSDKLRIIGIYEEAIRINTPIATLQKIDWFTYIASEAYEASSDVFKNIETVAQLRARLEKVRFMKFPRVEQNARPRFFSDSTIATTALAASLDSLTL